VHCAPHQSCAPGIVVQIGYLLLTEASIHDRLRMTALLPEVVLTVSPARRLKSQRDPPRGVRLTVSGQLVSGVSPERSHGLAESIGVELPVERHEVHVRRHDDKRVDAQLFLVVAVVQTVSDDLARLLGDEHGKPVAHSECEEVE